MCIKIVMPANGLWVNQYDRTYFPDQVKCPKIIIFVQISGVSHTSKTPVSHITMEQNFLQKDHHCEGSILLAYIIQPFKSFLFQYLTQFPPRGLKCGSNFRTQRNNENICLMPMGHQGDSKCSVRKKRSLYGLK
jgi:hypothetical protein